jgi:lysine 6-dehydrogenase
MRVLALGGAGAVAREATRDLCQHGSIFREIVIADIDPAKAERLARDIGDPRLQVVPLDVRDEEALVRLIRGFDVVMNGLPFAYDVLVTRACVEAGVSGVDLAFDEAQFELDEAARSKNMVFIPGVGATPGTTNVMAAYAARSMDQVESVEIAFAAFPLPGALAGPPPHHPLGVQPGGARTGDGLLGGRGMAPRSALLRGEAGALP